MRERPNLAYRTTRAVSSAKRLTVFSNLRRVFAVWLLGAVAVAAFPSWGQDGERERSNELARQGQAQVAQGNLSAARASLQQSLDILRRCKGTGVTQLTLDMIVRLTLLGDVQVRQGDVDGAFNSYQEHLVLTRRMVAAEPLAPARQELLVVSLSQLGDMQLRKSQLAAAAASYQEALKVSRQMVAASPNSAALQFDLSMGLAKVGDVLLAQSDRASASKVLMESIEIERRLAAADPGSADVHRALTVNLMRMSEITNNPAYPREALDVVLGMRSRSILAPADAWMVDDLLRLTGR